MKALVPELRAYLERYMSFPGPCYSLVLALWTIGTHLWRRVESLAPDSPVRYAFDAFPYLTITSETKRCGKTRLAELLSFVVARPRNFTALTTAALFRCIRYEGPTVFVDEAEALGSEAAGNMRAVLNSGYRRGQTVPRANVDGTVEDWPVYCPKAFMLIGDVMDTLRDRSIILRLRRGSAPARFLFEVGKTEGEVLKAWAASWAIEHEATVTTAYRTHAGLAFLTDRDEEIWTPLFALAACVCPDALPELERAAADLSTEKTAPRRRHTELEGMEDQAEADEYAQRLLRDLAVVIGTHRSIFTADALAALRELPTGPWRKFRGEGLDEQDLANMLSRFGITPRVIRTGNSRKKGTRLARGYRRADILDAVSRL